MKKGILFLLLASTVVVHGQSLKDALFSGKLKNTPGTVIRKGEDLSTKMDTTQQTARDEAGKTTATPLTADSANKEGSLPANSSVVSSINKGSAAGTATNAAPEAANTSNEKASVPKNNNAVWKEYIDSAISTLKTEVLPSKKIKAGTYYATVSYTINTDGKTDVGDVFLSPDNSYLQQQIKERLTLDPPQLSPVLNSTGAPRKVTRKYNFTLSKE